jgi:signal transduction histidine kinase
MGEIIQNYLSFTRGNPERVRVNVNELIRDTVLLLQPVFKQHSISVTTDLAEFLPVIYADGNSIQRVLINLLDNAVDACGSGGSVKIGTRGHASLNNKEQGVTIELTDTGAGIPPEILPKVFDLFVTTKPPGKGTGLGLIICQEIVKAHGGTIEIASQLGVGTTVGVFLPIKLTSEPALAIEDRNERPAVDC